MSRFCAPSCCPATPRVLSEVFSTSFSDVSITLDPGILLGNPISSVLTFTLGCTSSVSISAPLSVVDITNREDSPTPTVLTLPVVVTNVLPPTTSISSSQPISVFVPLVPEDAPVTATPTETLVLGPGTYTVVIYGRIPGPSSHTMLVSGEINVLAVRRSI